MRHPSALPLPPGPPGVPYVGDVLRAWKDPLSLIVRETGRLGPTVHFMFGPHHYVVVHDPADIRRLLVTHRDNYPKSRNYESLRLVLGDGLVTSDGEFWRRQRRLAQPAFHHERLVGFAEQMTRCTEDLLDEWDGADTSLPIDVHAEMMRLTFRIVGRTLFSTELGDAVDAIGPAISVALTYANDHAEAVVRIPPWIPTPDNLRFRRAKRTLDRIMIGIIEQRRRMPERQRPADLLSMLMDATDEDGTERMSDAQLRDEVMTLVLAGHETTAVALSWTFYLLSKHPEVERRVVAELAEVLGERPPTFDDLRHLPYLGRVVDEAMRLYPPVWIFERQAVEDDVLGGYRIPAGTIVAVCSWSLHRDRRLWDNPEGFDPDRFLPERADARPRYAYMPFGGGPRVCIGNAFALMEAKLVAASVLRRYRLELVPGHSVRIDAGITLRPRHGVTVRRRRRRATEPGALPMSAHGLSAE